MTAPARVIDFMGWQSTPPGWDLPDPGEADWRDQALCAETDPEVFFVEKGGSSRPAKRVCMACEVRAECLEYALGNREAFGIWGGLSEAQRRPLLAARDEAAGIRWCRSRRHVMDKGNTGADGCCLACRRESDAARRTADRVARTGSSSPQPGRRLAA